jgi:hypothetical protein
MPDLTDFQLEMTRLFLSLPASDPSWLKLVRTSAGAADGFEGLAEVVG